MATSIIAYYFGTRLRGTRRRVIAFDVRMLFLALTLTLLPLGIAQAQAVEPGPGSLTGKTPPPVVDILNGNRPLSHYVKNTQRAIELGKALFWDTQAGSDGQACASCHFHAGADSRTKNQRSTGFNGGNAVFDPSATTNPSVAGANYTLKKGDYPFHMKVDITERSESPGNVSFDTDDVTSSQGVIEGLFNDIIVGSANEDCTLVNPDSFGFHVNNVNTRRVEPRNTPTIVNAVFNFENFWNGRADNIFNGVGVFGLRNPNAFILENNAGVVSQLSVGFDNSSLASQAVGPPGSAFEMGCTPRPFQKIAKKLLNLIPLGQQVVHSADSVLSSLSQSPGTGLNKSYQEMIELAFENQYWDSGDKFDISGTNLGAGAPVGTDEFTQMEFNFSFFWGIAIQLFEATQIGGQTPFDAWVNAGRPGGGVPGFGTDEIAGHEVFLNDGKCVNCHATAMFTKASTLHLVDEAEEEGLVERMLMGDQDRGPALYDNGFYNIGVRPTSEDIGRGGQDPFGNELSFTEQYIRMLRGLNAPDPFQIDECTFEIRFDNPLPTLDPSLVVTAASGSAGDLTGNGFDDPFPVGFEFVEVSCIDDEPDPTTTIKPEDPDTVAAANQQLQDDTIKNFRTAVDGAFKVPTLRNTELTGPFFHNGGQHTLEQVVEFYNRGGDFAESNERNLDPDIVPLGLSDQQQTDLVAFMKALTDERVRCKAAPFDHPSILVFNGAVGDHNSVLGAGGVADDSVRNLDAVGAAGLSAEDCVIPFLAPRLINAYLQVIGGSTSYTPGTCPAGVFTYTATFQNTVGGNTLFDIFSKVTQITGGNTVLNSEGGTPTGGVGAVVETALGDSGNGNGLLNPGENFSQPYDICLQSFNGFSFFVDEYGPVENLF